MGRIPRIGGGTSIVLWPALAGLGGALAMLSRPAEDAGLVDTEWGVEPLLAELEVIEQHTGLFTLAAALFYAAALVMIPALIAIWRLSVDRAPRWAWAGAVVATLGVVGQVVHLNYFAGTLAAVGAPDRRAAAEFLVALDSTPFVLALFFPFLLSLLAPVVQVVGLRRARVVPLWAALAVSAGVGLVLGMGNVQWSNALATGLLVAGFAPAARAVLLGGRGAATVAEPARTSAARA